MSDTDTDPDDDLPAQRSVEPTPVTRPNVYGPDQATELATHAVAPPALPEALGSRISAGRRIVPTKKYVFDETARRVNRKRWF